MLIMPYNGVGPPPLFDDGKTLFGTNWRLAFVVLGIGEVPKGDNAFEVAKRAKE